MPASVKVRRSNDAVFFELKPSRQRFSSTCELTGMPEAVRVERRVRHVRSRQRGKRTDTLDAETLDAATPRNRTHSGQGGGGVATHRALAA